MENQENLKPIFNNLEKKINDTYNLLGIIDKNKSQINFIKKNLYDIEKWELPYKYYLEIKILKKQNKKLLNKLIKMYKNEK